MPVLKLQRALQLLKEFDSYADRVTYTEVPVESLSTISLSALPRGLNPSGPMLQV